MPRLTVQTPIKPLKLLATRWLMAATLVFGTYNPSGRSYWHWVTGAPELTPLAALVGIFLLVALVAMARMTYSALGVTGIGVVLSLIFAGIMLQIGLGWSSFEEMRFTGYTLLFWITMVMSFGVSWATLQKSITGERDILRTPP